MTAVWSGRFPRHRLLFFIRQEVFIRWSMAPVVLEKASWPKPCITSPFMWVPYRRIVRWWYSTVQIMRIIQSSYSHSCSVMWREPLPVRIMRNQGLWKKPMEVFCFWMRYTVCQAKARKCCSIWLIRGCIESWGKQIIQERQDFLSLLPLRRIWIPIFWQPFDAEFPCWSICRHWASARFWNVLWLSKSFCFRKLCEYSRILFWKGMLCGFYWIIRVRAISDSCEVIFRWPVPEAS